MAPRSQKDTSQQNRFEQADRLEVRTNGCRSLNADAGLQLSCKSRETCCSMEHSSRKRQATGKRNASRIPTAIPGQVVTLDEKDDQKIFQDDSSLQRMRRLILGERRGPRPIALVPVARSYYFAPFRACAGRSKHVSSAASSRCCEYPHREALWKVLCVFLRALSVGDSSRDSSRLLRSFSTWFRRVWTSPPLHRDFFRHLLLSRRPHRESVLRTSLYTARVSCALRCLTCRRRTFELLGLCCCPDVMSSSSWILSFAPSMANSTLCLSRDHHSSCLFMNCLFKKLNTVGVSVTMFSTGRDYEINPLEIRTVRQLHAASVWIHPDTSLESLQHLSQIFISCMLCITFP